MKFWKENLLLKRMSCKKIFFCTSTTFQIECAWARRLGAAGYWRKRRIRSWFANGIRLLADRLADSVVYGEGSQRPSFGCLWCARTEFTVNFGVSPPQAAVAKPNVLAPFHCTALSSADFSALKGISFCVHACRYADRKGMHRQLPLKVSPVNTGIEFNAGIACKCKYRL